MDVDDDGEVQRRNEMAGANPAASPSSTKALLALATASCFATYLLAGLRKEKKRQRIAAGLEPKDPR